MVKVSVIVPAYNVENYIEACFDSIVNQTLKEIEIIIINDGSTDGTKEKIEKYQKQYPNTIKVITKENEGQGKARNIGIDTACGEFVTFVDADDTIEPEMLKNMYRQATKEQADMILCDYYEIIQGKKVRKKAIPQVTKDLKKDYVVSVAGPCNKLIRTSILKENNLRFLETGIYEDIAMIPLIGLYANKVIYLSEPYYNYYIRQGSTMRQKEFNNKLLSIYTVMETLTKGFQVANKQEKFKEELEYIYIRHLLYAGTGRFLEYKEGMNQVHKIVSIMKQQYPNWRKNPYYKKQNWLFKLNCNIFYSNQKWLIYLFQALKQRIKHSKNKEINGL